MNAKRGGSSVMYIHSVLCTCCLRQVKARHLRKWTTSSNWEVRWSKELGVERLELRRQPLFIKCEDERGKRPGP